MSMYCELRPFARLDKFNQDAGGVFFVEIRNPAAQHVENGVVESWSDSRALPKAEGGT